MTPEEAYKRLGIDEWNFAVGSDSADDALTRELEEYSRRCAAVCFAEGYNALTFGICESEKFGLAVYAMLADDVWKEDSFADMLRRFAEESAKKRKKLRSVFDQVMSEFDD